MWGISVERRPSLTLTMQDGSGWTPLMIAASIPDGEAMVDFLLQTGADVNIKSETRALCLVGCSFCLPLADNAGQVSRKETLS
jgi:ankyrin repeat protein